MGYGFSLLNCVYFLEKWSKKGCRIFGKVTNSRAKLGYLGHKRFWKVGHTSPPNFSGSILRARCPNTITFNSKQSRQNLGTVLVPACHVCTLYLSTKWYFDTWCARFLNVTQFCAATQAPVLGQVVL